MLPQKLPYEMMITRWASILNPLLKNQLSQGQLISNISLNAGVNVINHLLGRTQIGFIITDIDAAAQIYRSAPLNNLTLSLTSDNPCTVSLWCF